MIRQATYVEECSGINAEIIFHQQRNDINTYPYPCIVACGYRHVLIRKTRRTFPAWLIAFDDSQRNIAWRTKHDFLILQRSIKSTSIHCQLPKTSLSKLADAAPWVAPSMEVTAATLVDACDGINNWDRKMQKNLLQINQFIQRCCASQVEVVSSAWNVFARPGDTEHVMDPSSCSLDTCNEQDKQQSHELGQYFCSSENASFLIDKCFEQIRSRFGAGDDSVSNKPDIVFVEPSVGRGDIVAALCSRLQDGHSISNQTIQILGFDLDAAAVDHCRQQRFAGASNSKLAFATTDFLETHRRDHVSNDNALVVFVGNPPFVAHGEIHDKNNDMPQSQQQPERNICLHFIQHALLEWNAQLVAFIMPQRFRCYDYSAIPLMSSMTLHLETLELPSKRFFFQGHVAVQQPAILQCFWSGE